MNILLNFVGPLRVVCITIDHVLYSLLGKVYSIVIGFSSAELLNHDTIKQMSNNLYVLIGVIAFFRLAVVLVNAIIDPDKLNEKGKGISNIFFRVVGMIILLVVTPFLFQKSYELQSKIVKNNLVFKVILGDKAGNLENNPGQALKSITISSLITVDKNFATFDAKSGYTPTEKCTRSCEDAVEEYNKEYKKGKFNLTKLSKYIDGSKKIDGQEIYYYDYMMILTGIVGIFMTWIIISFGIDIAVRMFELITLELLSPLFIATFVDPKSAQSGPFKNWLSAVGNSYLSLYIRLAILALMLLLISTIKESTIFDNFGTSSGFAKIFMVIGLLIFAKKAPKWISDMIGLKGDGTGLWSPKKMRENMFGGAAIAGATAGATALGLAGAKRLGSIHRDNKERRKDLTGHSSILGSKIALSKDKKEIGRLEDRLNNPNLSKEERNETQKTLAERKEAYEKNKNALKDISGGKAVANQLRNAAGDGIVNAVGDFKAGVKAGSITGAVKVASDRNAVYKEENALRGQTISEKVGEWAQNRVKKSSQLAFGSRNDRDEIQEQQKKIQKASDWTGLGDFGKQGVGLGKGNIVVGQKDANVVCDSLRDAGFSVNSKNFAAAQYALNRGYVSLDENGKIDLSEMKFHSSSNSFDFNGEGKISAEKLEKNCGGIMDSSSAAMVNQEKMVNTYQNNVLNTYQQNEQARAQELNAYQTAMSQSKAIGDAISQSIKNVMENTGVKIDTSSMSTIKGSFDNEIKNTSDMIKKLGDAPENEKKKKELEEKKETLVDTLDSILQNAELKQTFDVSASSSVENIKKLVAQNQEIQPTLDSIKGATIAEKQNNLSIESKNISDKEQRLTEDKKSKKGE